MDMLFTLLLIGLLATGGLVIARLQRWRHIGRASAARRALDGAHDIDPSIIDPRDPGSSLITDRPWDFGPKQD